MRQNTIMVQEEIDGVNIHRKRGSVNIYEFNAYRLLLERMDSFLSKVSFVITIPQLTS
jgi:hypothetical protein